MKRGTFKELLSEDVNQFMSINEFGDKRTIDGKPMTVIVDDNEIIEREKATKSNMDGVYTRQKLIYVKADEFGPMPALGRLITMDNRKYLVIEATDEQGIYAITMEANKSK